VRNLLAPLALASLAATALVSQPAGAYDCYSSDPKDWPPPAKPYFMVIVDASGSMIACTNPQTNYPNACPSNAIPNSCGWIPYRVNGAKCALHKAVDAFGGQVNFGFATFSRTISGCPNQCRIASR